MRCPFCHAEDTKVNDSRLVLETNTVKRRRSCEMCSERFTTFETVELQMPRVVKRDESRQAFDESRLRRGLLLALEKRPVQTEQIEQALSRILQKVRFQTEKEISSAQIGELVMSELKKLDEVAYVRFASVYRRFQDLDEFRLEIDRIKSDNRE